MAEYRGKDNVVCDVCMWMKKYVFGWLNEREGDRSEERSGNGPHMAYDENPVPNINPFWVVWW